MVIRTERGRRPVRVYYTPQAKAYTLYLDTYTEACALEARSPYESTGGLTSLSHAIGEEWNLSSTAALSDRKASYPEVIFKWDWSATKGNLTSKTVALLTVEYQVEISGPQPVSDNVTISYHRLAGGAALEVRESVKTWRHLDDAGKAVGVLAFAVVDLVPGVSDAGVMIRCLDHTPFAGYRTAHWTFQVVLETARLESVTPETMTGLMDLAHLLEAEDLMTIGYPASRRSSISSFDGLPDLATLKSLTGSREEVVGVEEAPECLGGAL